MDRRGQLTGNSEAPPGGAAPAVWITRALPAAQATAARVAALGFTPVVEPLIETRPLALAAPDLSPYAALAFTSAAGVRAFARLSADRRLPVFTVGEATAAAARAAGFAQVTRGEGDVAALDALLARAAPGRTLAPGAARPAGALAHAERLAVYDTRAARGSWPGAKAAALTGRLAAVLVHSPSAGRRLAALAQGADWLLADPPPRILALSAACSAGVSAALPRAPVEIAAAPNEAALLRRLRP